MFFAEYGKAFDEDIPYKEVPYESSPYVLRKNWETAFGLQETDGLKPSDYIVALSEEHINGNLTYEELEKNVKAYYIHSTQDDRGEEADLSSIRINRILASTGFRLSPVTLMNYHKQIFEGVRGYVYPVGKFRDVNISKEQQVLGGLSVNYIDFREIKDTLIWDFEQENSYPYKNKSKDEIAHHVMKFISNVWQIHPFREGNTRTIAVFTIKYLRHYDFEIDNEPFKEHSKYFRNALVIDNAPFKYKTNEYLQKFTENTVLSGNNVLDLNDMVRRFHLINQTENKQISQLQSQKDNNSSL